MNAITRSSELEPHHQIKFSVVTRTLTFGRTFSLQGIESAFQSSADRTRYFLITYTYFYINTPSVECSVLETLASFNFVFFDRSIELPLLISFICERYSIIQLINIIPFYAHLFFYHLILRDSIISLSTLFLSASPFDLFLSLFLFAFSFRVFLQTLIFFVFSVHFQVDFLFSCIMSELIKQIFNQYLQFSSLLVACESQQVDLFSPQTPWVICDF